MCGGFREPALRGYLDEIVGWRATLPAVVDNQHQLIKGYRDLPQDDLDLINSIKNMEEAVAALWQTVDTWPGVGKRWSAISRTHLQEGFSALVRAVALPADPFEDPTLAERVSKQP